MEKTLFSELIDYDAYDEAEIMRKYRREDALIKSLNEFL